MIKGAILFFLYIMYFLVDNIYALDLNINDKDSIYSLKTNMNIIVKKEKIKIFWDSPAEDPNPETFTLEILTNHTVDPETHQHYCAGSYVIANNITEHKYKWRAIKLQKWDMYTFLVRANGYEKYGFSPELYYAPDLYKFIKNKKGNNTFFIPYKHLTKEMKNVDVQVPLDTLTQESNAPAIEVPQATAAPIISNPVTSDPTIPPIIEEYNNVNEEFYGVNMNLDEGEDNDRGVTISPKELQSTKFRAITTASIISMVMFVSFLMLSIYSYQRGKENKKEEQPIIIIDKDKTATCSCSEGYTQDFIDYKSDTADSEILREQLKKKGLEIERKKLMDSMKEKHLSTSGVNDTNYISDALSNALSNAISNSNTDLSWQGLEVMTFAPPMKVNKPSNNGNYSGNNKNQNIETRIEMDIVNVEQPLLSDVDDANANSHSSSYNEDNVACCGTANNVTL